MNKWEYKVIALHDAFGTGQLQDKLNAFGAEGWEAYALVETAGKYIVFLKRVKQ